MKTLYRFDSADAADRWAIVNDDVMGGVSQSGLGLSEDDTLLFAGTVSLENNGGFASIRSSSEMNGLKDMIGIRLSVRGDGKLYRFRLYSADSRGVAYEAAFQTTVHEWQLIDLPFSEFEPTIRGRLLTELGTIDPATIEAVGFIVKDNQVGDFLLEVASIEAYC